MRELIEKYALPLSIVFLAFVCLYAAITYTTLNRYKIQSVMNTGVLVHDTLTNRILVQRVPPLQHFDGIQKEFDRRTQYQERKETMNTYSQYDIYNTIKVLLAFTGELLVILFVLFCSTITYHRMKNSENKIAQFCFFLVFFMCALIVLGFCLTLFKRVTVLSYGAQALFAVITDIVLLVSSIEIFKIKTQRRS